MIKTTLAVLALAAALTSGGFWLFHQSDKQLPKLRTAPVERDDLQFTIDATGTVEPEEVVDVGAQVAGKIQSLGVDPRDPKRTIDYGSPVNVNTVLARIDDSLYQSDVEQCQAQVDSAQAFADSTAAQVAEAQANIERAEKDLLQLKAKKYQADRDWARAQEAMKTSRGAISDSDFDLAKSTADAADAAVGVGVAAIAQANALLTNAKATVTKAHADLSTARANLKRAQTNLGYCTIKSPVEGVIIDRRINVGQTVVSSFNSPSLFLIAKDLKRMQVWASVNEADIGHIRSGQNVTFTVDAYQGKTFHGVVAPDQPRLNASMNQNVVTYTVVVNTDNSNGLLLPYLTADLQFEVDRRPNVLMVPNVALRWHPSPDRRAASGLPPESTDTAPTSARKAADSLAGDIPAEATVWVVSGENIRPVKVRTGLSDSTRTEIITTELNVGDLVAVGEELAADSADSTDPFSPKMFSGNRRPQQ